MSYESKAEPIKVGYLLDFRLPDNFPAQQRLDLIRPFELVFEQGFRQGVIDRRVNLIFREVEGLPKGSIKAVIDAYAQLVDEGCLVIFGPAITDNAVPLREEIETRFKVPAVSNTGTEDWLGEWTFSLPQGSLTDEPYFWAELLQRRGLASVGVLIEKSLIGETYANNFRRACREKGISIVQEERIFQTAQGVGDAMSRLRSASPHALVHCGFGFGVVFVNDALKALDWNPPRFMGTAFQNAWINSTMWQAILGWTGIDQYDEGNSIGREFLDLYEKTYGRRPEYCVPVMKHDIANILLQALSDAHPLTPKGVKEALSRLKMLPAASGSEGTRISFGNWMHRGWVGNGYLVARELNEDGITSRLVGRFNEH